MCVCVCVCGSLNTEQILMLLLIARTAKLKKESRLTFSQSTSAKPSNASVVSL